MTRVTVLGAGGWGIALATLLDANGHRVTLWARDASHAAEMDAARENKRALPGYRIPQAIAVTADCARAVVGAERIVVTVPAQFARKTLEPFRGAFAENVACVTGTKGLEIGTMLRPTEVLRDVLGERPTAVLSGPSHAEEIVIGLPASVVSASADAALARDVRDHFNSARMRVYVSTDLAGVELSGALKNVMAVAAGVCDGLGLGDNAKAALVTRALAEMTRYALAHGAQNDTFSGLAGIGDLMTTCYSKHGRNRSVGERVGRGEKLEAILAASRQVAEGVWTARALHDSGAASPDRMPITAEVYAILYEGKDPRRSVYDLMSRPHRE